MAWYLIKKPWPGQTWVLRSNISKLLSKADWDKNSSSTKTIKIQYLNTSLEVDTLIVPYLHISCVVTWLWSVEFEHPTSTKRPISCFRKPNLNCDVAQKASFNIFCSPFTVIFKHFKHCSYALVNMGTFNIVQINVTTCLVYTCSE